MIISHNIPALGIINNLGIKSNEASKSSTKLSTGLRINSASDDAAGLSISEKMKAQIRGLNQASKNINDGISLLQTGEGGLQEIHNILQRMRSLSVQMANGTYTDDDRMASESEYSHLKEQIDSISETTHFNEIYLLNKGSGVTSGTEVTAKKLEVIVDPGEVLVAGTINVPADPPISLLWVQGSFGVPSGADWPDINIISPTGEKFGYNELYLNSSEYAINESSLSATKAEYTGWKSHPEKMTFTNPVSGTWTIEVRNLGGTLPSPFYIESNLDITINPGLKSGLTTTPQETIYIQAGPNEGQGLKIPLINAKSGELELHRTSVITQSDASNSIPLLDAAINTISTYRSQFGAYQNRLEHSLKNVLNYEENLQASQSRIADADIAKEIMRKTVNDILSQSAMAMLSQANSMPQNILSLLK